MEFFVSHAASSSPSDTALRLVWPQWQGAGTQSVRSLAPEFPFDVARPGYTVGTKVLQAVLPEHDGPTAVVPVEMGDVGLEERDGIEAKTVVLQQLRAALAIIRQHDPARITTLGGECSASMAPFSYLIDKYGDDLAILWIDSHPDMGTGETDYPGYHAMVVSALTGHGDTELLDILPATTTADRVALVGMHDWTDPTLPAIADDWGLTVFAPDVLRSTSASLLDWLDKTGATKVATISTSTRSTQTRSSSVSAPTSAGSLVQKHAAWSPTSTPRPTSSL
jgi:arginase